MTADEFEAAYAARSGLTVEKLRALGRIVAPCNCGDQGCDGWQSTTQARVDDEARYRVAITTSYDPHHPVSGPTGGREDCPGSKHEAATRGAIKPLGQFATGARVRYVAAWTRVGTVHRENVVDEFVQNRLPGASNCRPRVGVLWDGEGGSIIAYGEDDMFEEA